MIKIKIRFVRHVGTHYLNVVCPDVECQDLNHAARRAMSTCLKHYSWSNLDGAYMPYAFIYLDGITYRVDVYQNRTFTITELENR